MTIEKKEKLTLLQRIRILILGRERPNLITRISVGIGFGIWVYMISWQVLTLMSLTLMGSLKQAQLIKDAFNRIGSKLYYFSDTVEVLTVNTIAELAAYGVALFGLILIYRRKKSGFLIYLFANVIIVTAPILILGLKYFQYEWTYTDIILIGSTSLYFLIGALWMYRKKPAKKVENTLSEG